MPASGIPFVDRNNIFGKSLRFRSRLAGLSESEGINSLETQKIAVGNLALGATTLYTCPSSKRAKVMRGLVVIHNPTAGAIIADLYHVPSGGTVQTTNKFATLSIAANATVPIVSGLLWHVLLGGDALVINTGAVGLNAWCSILEERATVVAYLGGFIGNLANTDTVVYTSPALRSSAIKAIFAFNPTAGAIDLTVNVRETGVSVATTNQLAKQAAIAAGAMYQLDALCLPMVAQGGIVSAKGSVAGLNVWADAELF